MKKWIAIVFVLALTAGLAAPSAYAASPAQWKSSIVLANPNGGGAENLGISVTLKFSDGGPSDVPDQPINPYGSLEFNYGVTENFKGSAEISANQPVAAVYRQFPGGVDQSYAPILYTAFSANQASDSGYFIPTFVRRSDVSTLIGIQNIDGSAATLNLRFFKVGNKTGTPDYILDNFDISEYSSRQIGGVDFSALPGFPASFDGSLVISLQNPSCSDCGKRIVVAAQEIPNSGRRAYAFEGVPDTKVENADPTKPAYWYMRQTYMPSAMCKVGRTQQTSYYAVQNAGAEPAFIIVDYYDNNGKKIATQKSVKVYPGAKVSINTCSARGMGGKSGSAVIYADLDGKTSQNATTKKYEYTPGGYIAAMGKVISNDGLATAFTAPGSGSSQLSLPYIPWGASTYDYRAYIAVFNPSKTESATVEISYYTREGCGSTSTPIPGCTAKKHKFVVKPNGKGNSTPLLGGALTGGSFIGSAVVTSDKPVVVLVRVQKATKVKGYTTLGEDYTGVQLAP